MFRNVLVSARATLTIKSERCRTKISLGTARLTLFSNNAFVILVQELAKPRAVGITGERFGRTRGLLVWQIHHYTATAGCSLPTDLLLKRAAKRSRGDDPFRVVKKHLSLVTCHSHVATSAAAPNQPLAAPTARLQSCPCALPWASISNTA